MVVPFGPFFFWKGGVQFAENKILARQKNSWPKNSGEKSFGEKKVVAERNFW